jgi:hypothetical protein
MFICLKKKYVATDSEGSYSTVRLNSLSVTYIVLSAFKLHWKLNIFNFFNILSGRPGNELRV